MRNKKKLIISFFMTFVSMCAMPQAVVTDPTSMAQRITLFLEEMEEALSQSMDIAESSENTKKLFELSQETMESLKKVSDFIKTSRQLAEITEAELRIADKIKDYAIRIRAMNTLSFEEKANIINSLITMGAEASRRIKSVIDMVNGGTDAKLSDYERLQILTQVENEVLALEEGIDNAYQVSVSTSAVDGLKTTLENMSLSAMMFVK